MKYGRTLMELGTELIRQRDVKRDYLLDTDHIQMDYVANSGAHMLTLNNPMFNRQTLVGVNEIAHRQIGTQLGIPLRYYNKMREENPLLLADNVNSWMHKQPSSRMIRTLDGTARAFLSDRYRVIDNFEVANAVLPVIADMPDARIESCELTFRREGFDIDSFVTMPNMVDNLLQSVADHFDGRYRYLPIAGTVSITMN